MLRVDAAKMRKTAKEKSAVAVAPSGQLRKLTTRTRDPPSQRAGTAGWPKTKGCRGLGCSAECLSFPPSEVAVEKTFGGRDTGRQIHTHTCLTRFKGLLCYAVLCCSVLFCALPGRAVHTCTCAFLCLTSRLWLLDSPTSPLRSRGGWGRAGRESYGTPSLLFFLSEG